MLADHNGPEIPAAPGVTATTRARTADVAATASAAEVAATSAVVLPIDWQGQPQASTWCWAACGAMILSANGTQTTVEEAAAIVLGPNPAIDDEERPGDALTAMGLVWKTQPNGVGAPLSAQSMEQWIVIGRRPVEIYWLYVDQTGHVALVTGYDASNNMWRLLDPLQDAGWVSYDYLLSYNGQASWDNTFYAIGNAL
ncbi:papain-like cysteine protease family protein [Paucibacter sp. R3-3]|uniref:Papain-like cysteine protease family protein n=1 Tax=Roseateles agri TaxID=3098619 RepID=A0ABU5DN11_9BURK|nr:papain-like cysteine protease family protein [Paucibacter sp. R3-3]MDY0746442.1 papain-like cysteine protease family protein [Paucibacter sp. R3-3]